VTRASCSPAGSPKRPGASATAVYEHEADIENHPVLIGHSEPPAALADVLVSLAPEVPAWCGRFTRVAELVGSGESDKLLARERYRFYRERGYPLETHNL